MKTAEQIIDDNTFVKDGLITVDVAIKCMKLYAEQQGLTLPIDSVSERYSKDDVRKYGDDWKITTWDEGQKRRRIMAEGYKTRDEAEHDREIFNAR